MESVDQHVLASIVGSVWGTVLDLAIEPLPAGVDSAPDLSANVHIAGEWNGVVLFWPTERFARLAASRLFAIREEDVTPADVQDGMAELCNIVAGNVKALLPGPAALSLPTVTRGPEHEIFVRRTRPVAELVFESAGQSLAIRLLEGVPPVGEQTTLAGARR